MHKEVMPPRSWYLELVAISAAIVSLAACAAMSIGCADAPPADGIPAPEGQVFTCYSSDRPGAEQQWCYDGDALDVPGYECVTGVRDQISGWATAFCRYDCEDTSGCQAFNGCWCAAG